MNEMLQKVFFCLVSLSILVCSIRLECEFHVSPDLPTVFEVKQGLIDGGSVTADGSYQICHHQFGQCAALWSFDPETNDTTVLLKGCWKGNAECERLQCIASETINHRYLNNSRFCCCSSFNCNANVSFVPATRRVTNYLPNFLTVKTNVTTEESSNVTTLLIVICILFAIAALVFGALIYWLLFRSKINKAKGENLEKNLLISTTDNNVGDKFCSLLPSNGEISTATVLFPRADRLILMDVIGRGRYSVVRRARLTVDVGQEPNENDEEEFAVKMYENSNKNYFLNERNLLSLALLNHENVVKFYGAYDRLLSSNDSSSSSDITNATETPSDYWLVMKYMPSGTLQDYLKSNTFDFHSMCKIALSVAKGLAFLHMEFRKNGLTKPAIAHRDINSRNVLMKTDGSCVICDLGFAMSLDSTKFNGSCEEVCLTEVGTVRYMAPEVLEGAVNLRDPETSLKQVDVYALGLVIWEVISRCYDITGSNCPEYSPPYAKEALTTHPSLEQMQLLVCKKKVRPLFPSLIYKLIHAPLRDLRDLVEDCWDQDSEARITALCAQGRLTELFQAVIVDSTGPKYVCTSNNRIDSNVIVDLNALNAANINRSFMNRSYLNYQAEFQRPSPHFNESTADTGTTSGLGSMFMNSSDRARSFNSGSSLGYQRNASDVVSELGPLQSFQGLNPCLERNLHTESSDSSSSGYGNRVTESNFDKKIDPCAADQLIKYVPGASLLLAKTNLDYVDKNHEAQQQRQCFVTNSNNSATAPMGGGDPARHQQQQMCSTSSNNEVPSEYLLARLLLKNRGDRCSFPSAATTTISIKNDFEQQQSTSAGGQKPANCDRAISSDVSPVSSSSGGGGGSSSSGSDSAYADIRSLSVSDNDQQQTSVTPATSRRQYKKIASPKNCSSRMSLNVETSPNVSLPFRRLSVDVGEALL